MGDSTREAWLLRAITFLEKRVFKQSQLTLPDVKVSVGFAYGYRSKKIGQHWAPEASDDKKGQIFICPTIGKATEALDVLTHELVHASVGTQAKHGPIFRKAALAVGLKGPMRSTTASAQLINEFKTIIKEIGPYPHARLDLGLRPGKKQTTRLHKMECLECGYVTRASRKHILFRGPVICPCNFQAMSTPDLIFEDTDYD
jgi:hypothetical protein